MIYLKLNAKGDAVALLQELLNEFNYNLIVNGSFNAATDEAVRDFQLRKNLVSDGVVYTKTWTKLINTAPVDLSEMESKFLKEEDMINAANFLGVELAVIKAVNAVESRGRGFNVDGNTKILFEGHVFWSQLKKRGINPQQYVAGNEDVLYEKWTKKYYVGGKGEYARLNKAIAIASSADVAEAAYASASWGLYQVMGYHYKDLGYSDIIQFVGEMKENEGKQLNVFTKYIIVNNLKNYLKNKNWASFARQYNGPGYKDNKYDEKLQDAYLRFR